MNYTSIEQSRKLLELGLDANTADFHCIDDHYNIPEVIAGFCNGWYEDYKESDRDYIPIWSVGALLEVMPEQITYSDFKPFPLGLFKGDKDTHSKYGHYWIQYFDPEHGGAYVQTNGYSPLEAAYNMVVWLLENNYIKKD